MKFIHTLLYTALLAGKCASDQIMPDDVEVPSVDGGICMITDAGSPSQACNQLPEPIHQDLSTQFHFLNLKAKLELAGGKLDKVEMMNVGSRGRCASHIAKNFPRLDRLSCSVPNAVVFL